MGEPLECIMDKKYISRPLLEDAVLGNIKIKL